jgi:SMC interacting uncharacterized protein involved in chromosome segregation
MSEQQFENLLTEITSLRAVVSREIKSLRTEMNTEITSLKAEMSTEIKSLRAEVTTEIDSLKTEMNTRFDSVEKRLGGIEADLDKIEMWTGYRADPNLPRSASGKPKKATA